MVNLLKFGTINSSRLVLVAGCKSGLFRNHQRINYKRRRKGN